MSLRVAKLCASADIVPETREEMLALVPDLDYSEDNDDPIRTKQAFVDSCDVNKMLAKSQTGQTLAHLQKYPEAVYGEFDGNFGLLDAHARIQRASEIFADLPSEVRSEYDNDPLRYVTSVNKMIKEGKDITRVLPAIAQPGRYFPNPIQRDGAGAGIATAPSDPGDPPAPAPDPAPEAPSTST